MKKLLLFIIGILIIILENTVTNYIDFFGISLNILLIYSTIIALYANKIEIVIISTILGFIKDITVGGVFGMNALILFFIVYSISHLNDKIYKENYITIFVLVFITSLFDAMINIGLVEQVYIVDTIRSRIIQGVLIYPFINAIMSVVLYIVSKKSIVKLKES